MMGWNKGKQMREAEAGKWEGEGRELESTGVVFFFLFGGWDLWRVWFNYFFFLFVYQTRPYLSLQQEKPPRVNLRFDQLFSLLSNPPSPTPSHSTKLNESNVFSGKSGMNRKV